MYSTRQEFNDVKIVKSNKKCVQTYKDVNCDACLGKSDFEIDSIRLFAINLENEEECKLLIFKNKNEKAPAK